MKSLNFASLLASTVHDVKNLLGGAMEGLDWLDTTRQNLNDEQTKKLGKLSKTISQINHDLTQLLFLYKLENQNLRLNLRQADVAEFVEVQLAYLDSMHRNHEIKISHDIEANLTCYFDEMLAGIALRNAVINALKVARSRIEIGASCGEAFGLRLQISDDGPGFPERMLSNPNIGLRGEAQGNTGLGLYFCQQVASLHHLKNQMGKIKLHNRLNDEHQVLGACFELYLPQP